MKTPQLSFPKLSETLGIKNEVWLKREDLHKYGSHKGRSIPLMISEYRKQGVTNFVISSSGNAALAAAISVETFNKNANKAPLTLTVYVGKNIDPKKLFALNKFAGIRVIQTDSPKQEAFRLDKEGKAKLIRQSTDDLALLGYRELAAELAKIQNLSAMFIPTSSGATAEGLYEGFSELGLCPEIHIVQTEECHPMVTRPLSALPLKGEEINPLLSRRGQGEVSLALAIVDKVAHRKQAVLDAIKNSRGAGWVATNTEIVQAEQLVKTTTGIDISANSALAIVGLIQAIKSGRTWNGAIVCLITGA